MATKFGSAFVELFTDSTKLTTGLSDAEKNVTAFGAKITKIGAALSAASASIVAPLTLSLRSFAAFGDSLDKMSKRTGMSVQSLAELRFAASQSGADIGVLEKATTKMQSVIFDANMGLTEQVRAFDALGVSAKSLVGLSIDEQFNVLSSAIGGIADDGKRSALAMDIMGKSAVQLLPLFAAGANGIDQMRQEARDLNLVPTNKMVEDAAKITDAWDKVGQTFEALKVNIGAAIAGPMTELFEAFAKGTAKAIEFAKSNGQLIIDVSAAAVAIGGIGSSLVGIGIAMQAWPATLAAITVSLHPLTAALIGLTAAAAAAKHIHSSVQDTHKIIADQETAQNKAARRVMDLRSRLDKERSDAMTPQQFGDDDYFASKYAREAAENAAADARAQAKKEASAKANIDKLSDFFSPIASLAESVRAFDPIAAIGGGPGIDAAQTSETAAPALLASLGGLAGATANIITQLASLPEKVAKDFTVSSAGTFSSTAIDALFGGEDAQKKTADNTAQTTKNTAEMLALMKASTGFSFS